MIWPLFQFYYIAGVIFSGFITYVVVVCSLMKHHYRGRNAFWGFYCTHFRVEIQISRVLIQDSQRFIVPLQCPTLKSNLILGKSHSLLHLLSKV